MQLAAPAPPRLYRCADGRMVAGVAQGVATHLAVQPKFVRIAFAVLACFNGFGIVLYLALWAVVPQEPMNPGTDPATVPRRRFERGTLVALAVGAVVIGGLLLGRGIPFIGANPLLVPLLLAAAGLAVLWSQADTDQRDRWRRISPFEPQQKSTPRWIATARFAGGTVLVAAGVGSFLLFSGTLAAARDGLVAAVAVLAGLALLTAPLWWRLVADLTEERRERIRSQERADLAAHLHDSVLQTLALVQKRADDPRAVATLARRQERELRAWLWDPGAPTPEASLAASLRAAAADVEEAHGVPVEVVTVGDAAVDDATMALVAAVREALTNAAKFAGDAGPVALYAESADDRIQVFVRDRGSGFDPGAIPADRRGVRDSIIARMARHGGRAAIHPAPGGGTEIELTLGGESA